jgi:transposase, IS30 family
MEKVKRLGLEDRCQIHVLAKRGYSTAEIAREVAVHRTTIWRELRRNRSADGYYYHLAQERAEKRLRARRKRCRKMTPEFIAFIEMKLRLGWSPQQISGWLKFRQDEQPNVSHERIYQHVWRDKLDGGKLYRHLRHGGLRYRCFYRVHGKKNRRCGPIPNRVDIDQRPEVVEKKSRIGDWELDTIIGSQHRGALVSMAERKSKLVRLALVHSCKSGEVACAIEASLASHKGKVSTLTMDNGAEFAKHKEFGKNLKADTYFAKPYHAWERGLNEHTNGLVRQYFPKSTDFTTVSIHEVQKVEDLLNNRPRAVLGFWTPLEVFSIPSSSRRVAMAS